MLKVESLHVRYGKVVALQDVSFDVEQGGVLAVLGRNGAGKSSLLRAIMGLARPAGGRISWKGKDVTKLPADRRSRMGMAMIPEGRRVFPNLTVSENLALGGFHLSRAELEAAVARVSALLPVLKERAGAPAGQLSGGQQQMLAVGRALIADPELLLLDEPSLGLAPTVISAVYERLERLRDQGITIVLVEQHVNRALTFADEAVVLSLGDLVLREDPATLAKDPRLVDAYMGGRSGH